MNLMDQLQQFGQMRNAIKSMKNPQQAVLQMLSNNTNPNAQNVLKMVQNGDYKGIEQFARNVVSEQGKDFDTEISNFRNNLGL